MAATSATSASVHALLGGALRRPLASQASSSASRWRRRIALPIGSSASAGQLSCGGVSRLLGHTRVSLRALAVPSQASDSSGGSTFTKEGQTFHRNKLLDGEEEILTEAEKKEKDAIIKELTKRLSGPLADDDGNVPTGKDRPIAIEVDGPSHFYANSKRYTAYTKLKHRLLTRMGYKVLHVPYFEWRRLRGAREREEYMRQKLQEEPSEWLDPEDEKYYTQPPDEDDAEFSASPSASTDHSPGGGTPPTPGPPPQPAVASSAGTASSTGLAAGAVASLPAARAPPTPPPPPQAPQAPTQAAHAVARGRETQPPAAPPPPPPRVPPGPPSASLPKVVEEAMPPPMPPTPPPPPPHGAAQALNFPNFPHSK